MVSDAQNRQSAQYMGYFAVAYLVRVFLSLCRRIRDILFIFSYFRLKLGENVKKMTALQLVVF